MIRLRTTPGTFVLALLTMIASVGTARAETPPPLPAPPPSQPTIEIDNPSENGSAPPRRETPRRSTMWDEPATPEPEPAPPKKKDNTGLYLLIGGGVAAGIGYGLGLEAMVSGISSQSDSAKCGMQPMLSLIPLFGPLAYMASMPPHNIYSSSSGRPEIYSCDKGNRGLTTGFAVSSEIFQIGGAAAAITGFVLMRSDRAKPAPTTSSVILHPGAAGAPLGLTMTVSTF